MRRRRPGRRPGPAGARLRALSDSPLRRATARSEQAASAGGRTGWRGVGAADVPELVEQARAGDARSVARLISLVEDASPAAARGDGRRWRRTPGTRTSSASPARRASASPRRPARWWGRCAPRAGASACWPSTPSSPFSGGALLGDRVRMQDHAADRGVYIRSMASRGHLGGLSWAAPQALRVLDAAGCDVILVETVGRRAGRGRDRRAGRHHAGAARAGHGRRHPGGQGGDPGDRRPLRGQQGRPRRRRPGRARAALHAALGGRRPEGAWRPEIVKTVASKGEGIDEVVAADRAPPGVAGRDRRAGAAPVAPCPRRDRGDRGHRAARAVARGARERRARRARRRGGRRRAATRTPRPTCCWRASSPSR